MNTQRLKALLSKVGTKIGSKNAGGKHEEEYHFNVEQLEPRMMLNGAVGDLVFQATFEDANVGDGSFAFFQNVSGLTATGRSVEVQNNHPAVGPASEGRKHLELDGTNGVFLVLDRGAVPGLVLQFDYSPRQGVSADQNAIEVYWNGNLVDTVSADGRGLKSTSFRKVEFELTGGQGRLELRSNSPSDTLGLGGLIDNVKVFEQLGPLDLAEIPDQIVAVGTEINLTAKLLPPNQNLTGAVYSLTNAPIGMQINSSTGEITWTASQENVDASDARNDEVVVGNPVLEFKAGFEDVTVPGDRYGFFPTVSGFTATGRHVEVQNNHPAVGPASEGQQHLELDGVNGIYRDIPTEQGDRYSLVLDYSPRPGVNANGNAVQLWWDGQLLETIKADGSNLRSTKFAEYRFDLSNFSGDLTRLELRSNNPNDKIGLGGLIDNIRLFHRTVDIIDGENGKYAVTVEVTDERGRMDTEEFLVCIQVGEQHEPVLAPIPNQVVNEESLFELTVTATDSDSSQTQLRFALVNAPGGATIDELTGKISWTPTEAQGPGQHSFEVKVTDQSGLTDTATFNVSVGEVNLDPVINPIPDGEVTEGDSFAVTVTASDPDLPANALTYSILQGPAGATINPSSGRINWTPNENQADNTFEIVVQVDDGAGGLDSESFNVTVVALPDRPPVINGVEDQSTNEEELLEVFLSASDPDSPNDALRFELVSGPQGVLVDAITGRLSWTPNEIDGPGQYEIQVKVTDETGLSDSTSFQVSVAEINQDPIITAVADLNVSENEETSFSIVATDADLPVNTLTYSLLTAPTGASIDPTTGLFSWTPSEIQGPGEYDITVQVSDGAGGFDTETFQIQVGEANSDPVLAPIEDQVINENTTFSIQASATDSDLPPQTITYSLAAAPEGATIDAESGVITWAATEIDGPGLVTFTVVATDSEGGSDTRSFQLRVDEVNAAPILDPISDKAVQRDELLEFTVTASDEDVPANELTFGFTGDVPTGATIDPETGKFSWTPTSENLLGDYEVMVTVSDGNGGSDVETFIISVTNIVELVEENRFETTFTKTILIEPDINELSFDFEDLFDSTDPDFINDAFEVALLDANGDSLVHTMSSRRDAFFNLTEDQVALGGVNTVITGSTVQLDLSHITVGTTATLVFRLVNNDADTETRVRIINFKTSDLLLNTPAGASITDSAPASNEEIDFDSLTDVTGSLDVNYGQTSFDADVSRLFADVRLTNEANHPIDGPFVLVVHSISDPLVALSNPDGFTPDGDRYYLLDDLSNLGTILPGESTLVQTLEFFNPGAGQFSYALSVLAQPNIAPEFVSAPNTEGLVGKSYTYDANAIDLDDDTLTFELMAGPTGLVVDSVTGEIVWAPGANDVGTHSVIVEVADGRGGKDMQQYDIEVLDSRPNRPPVIISTPVVDTYLAPERFADTGNLVINGDFSLGNTGFSTEYTHFPSNIFGAKTYAVVTDPRSVHGSAASFGDYTTGSGNMMVVNGSTTLGDIVWEQTVNVTAGTTYDFAAVLASWYPGSPADLAFTVNDIEIGQLQASDTTAEWDLFFATWESREATTATIRIVNGNIAYGGNDFALDDIYFGGPRFSNPSYQYQVVAVDPDFDPIEFELVEGPDGMQIDGTTGLISWNPDADDIGLHTVAVTANDGRGGTATQEYQLRVLADPTNTAPVIVSDPVDNFFVPGFSNPASGDVSPQRISLDLGNGETFEGTVSVTLPESAARFADIVISIDESASMGGDQDWIPDMIPLLDQALQDAGIGTTAENPNRFAIVGGGRQNLVSYFFSQQPNTKYTLYGPNNEVVAEGVIDEVIPDELLNLQFEDDGRYVLVVEAENVSDLVDGIDIGIEGEVGEGVRVEQLLLNTLVSNDFLLPGQPVEYQFTLTADTLLYFDSQTKDDFSYITWSLDGPTGRLANNVRFQSSDTADSTPTYTAVAGDYKLTIDSTYDVASDYKFQLIDLAAGTVINSGETVADEFETKVGTKAYRFNASQGQLFALDNSTTGVHSGSKWRLIDQAGNVLISQSIGTNQSPFELSYSGQYFLLMEAALSPLEGSSQLRQPSTFEFTAEFIDPAIPTPITLGDTINDAIDFVGDFVEYSFFLAERSNVYMDALVDNVMTWQLTGPAGTTTPLAFSSSDSFNQANPVKNLVAGEYVLRISSNNQEGDFAFRMVDLASATPITPGTEFSGELTLPSETDFYKFNALAGEEFFFDVVSASDVTYILYRIYDQYGRKLADSVRLTDLESLTIPADGEYTLLIEGWKNNTDLDTYTINAVPIVTTTLPLTLGTVTDGTLTTPGERQVFTFNLAADTQLYFDSLTNDQNIVWSLEGPRGEEVSSLRFDRSDSTDRTDATIDALAGDWQLTVQGNGDALGDYSFALLDLLNPAHTTPFTPIRDPDVPPVRIGPTFGLDPLQTEVFRFSAVAGDEFSFVTNVEGSIGSYYRIVDSNGTEVTPLTALITDRSNQVMTRGGDYLLLVEPRYNNVDVDEWSIDIGFVQNNGPTTLSGTPLTLGTTTSGDLNIASQVDEYTFEVTQRGNYYFDSLTNSGSIRWNLIGPTGTVVLNRTFTATDSFNQSNVAFDLIPGQYQIQIFASSGTPGLYDFRFHDLDSATPITPGIPFDGELPALAANETDLYKFDAIAGETFFFDVESASDSSNTQFKLIDPFGRRIFTSSGLNDFGPQQLDFDGTYTLLVEGWRGNSGPDTYTMNVHLVPAGPDLPLTLGAFNSGSISVPGETVTYNFSLGDYRQVHFDSLTNSSIIKWSLTDSVGTVVASRGFHASDSYTINNAVLDLPPDNYRLTVDANADVTGDFAFRLLDLSDATLIGFDSVVTDQLDHLGGGDAVWTSGVALSGSAINGAIDLSKPTDSLKLPAATLNGVSDFTIEFWYKTTKTGLQGLISAANSSDANELLIELISDTEFAVSGTASWDIDSVADGQWHHYAVTHETATGTTFYLDGINQGTQSGTLGTLSVDEGGLYIGQEQDAVGYNLDLTQTADGQLDELRIWETVRTETEIVGNKDNVIEPNPVDLRAYYRFDETGGDIAADQTSNGFDAQYTRLTQSNSTKMYQFTAQPGDIVLFESFGSDVQFSNTPYWRLVDQYGNQIFNSNFNAATTPITLDGGSYTLLIEGDPRDVEFNGGYSFQLTSLGNTFNPAAPFALTFGDVINGNIDKTHETDRYAFTLSDTTLAYFDALTNDSSLNWTLKNQLGTVVSPRTFNSSASSLLRLPAGDYELSITSNTIEPYSFAFYDLAASPIIVPGTPQTGELTTANETDIYRFSGQAGDQIYLDVASVSTASRANLLVVNELGVVLTSSTSVVDQDTFTLPADGQYFVIVEGKINQTIATTYEINLVPTNTVEVALALGATITSAIDTSGQSFEYSFNLPAQASLYFDSLTDNGSIQWSLAGAAGTVVTNRKFNASDSFNFETPLLKSLIAGDYTLTVTGVGDAVGDFSFRLSDVASGVIVSPGTPVNGELTIPNETDVYQFTAAAGDQILVDWLAADDTNNSLYRIYDPLGNEILELRDLFDADLPTLPFTGIYTLLVEGWRANDGLDTYQFNLVNVATRSVAINVGDTVNETVAIGEKVDFIFDATSDMYVHFDSLTNQSRLTWSLTGPTGDIVINRRFNDSDSVDETNSVFELRQGTYKLTVDGETDFAGDFAFSLLDVATATAITPGILTGVLNPGIETQLYKFDANAGDNFTFDFLPDPNDPTNGNAYYRLVDPFGNTVFTRVLTGDQNNVDLNITGTYTLLVEGRYNATVPNPYKIDVIFNGNTAPPALTGAALTLGATQIGDLNTAGQVDSYQFTLTQRSLLHMDVLTNSSSYRWSLRGPRGIEVSNLSFTSTDSLDSSTSNLDLTAGQYQLDIFASSGAPGEYGFTLHDFADAILITPGTEFSGELNHPAETDLYRFTASAGDRFLIDVVSTNDDNNKEFKLIDQYGIVVATSSLLRDLDEIVIPNDGTFTLLVEGRRNNTGADTYSINILPIATATFALSPGVATQGNIQAGEQYEYTFSLLDPSLLLFSPQTLSDQVNWTLSSDGGIPHIDSQDFDLGILPIDLLAGNYTLTVDGVDDYAGEANFTVVVADSSSQLNFGEISNTQLTQSNSVAVYQFNGVAGQHFALRPDFNLVFDDAATSALTADDLSTSYYNEDQHAGIDVALRNDVFRDGAAINFIIVSDEDRDVSDDNVNFETIFTDLSGRSALLNSIVSSPFRDANNTSAIGVDKEGNAYIADGAGGFIVTPGGIATTGNISIKQDYIDLAWALDGAAWDLGKLRAGGLTAESFTNAFIDVKVDEILKQTALRLISSDLDADFEVTDPVGGIYSDIVGGGTYEFEVRVGNNGQPISYDLLFKQGQTVGSIPVFIISPYQYGALAVDADGDALSWSIVSGPEGLLIDSATGVLAWTADDVVYGEHEITIRVDDGRGGFDEQSFVLDVNGGEAASISGRVIDLESFEQTTVNAVVSGKSDPYLAGMPDGSTASGSDVAPDHSPVLVEGLDLINGSVLTFSATGGVTFTGVPPASTATPDGDASPTGIHYAGAENGISDFVAPWNALVGVFLSNQRPDLNDAPETLDFSGNGNIPDGINYTQLSPELQQLFFIGDGVNADGTIQEITIPEGATRLYLGTTDGFGWYNNAGLFDVQITGSNYKRFGSFETIEINPYASVLDSPINTINEFVVEDFEDGELNVAGVTISAGNVFGPGGITDSVDSDDGFIDGSGTNGRSWYYNNGPAGITISFDESALGKLPTEAGVVWTDGAGLITFRAYDGLGNLIGERTSDNADSSILGTTSEDTFFGAQSQYGVSSLFISNAGGGIEIDHVQYSLAELPVSALQWTVFLDQNRNGILDEGEVSTTTDSNGDYAFTNIDSGSYVVAQVPQAGWRQVIPSIGQYEVSVDSGENLRNVDFGNIDVPIANTNPKFLSLPASNVVAGEMYSYSPAIEELDGDDLTFDLPLAPAGMAMNASNGAIRWTPRQDQIGIQNVLLRVRDGNGGYDLQYFQIEVVAPNSAPAITSTPPTGPAGVGLPYTYDVNAVDAQNDAIAFSLTTAPDGMTIDQVTGVVIWTPVESQIGSHLITVVALDERGLSSEQTFELSVELNPENVAPVFLSEPPIEARLGDNYLYRVRTFDQNGDPTMLTLDEAPAGMTLDSSGLIVWEPQPTQLGEQLVRLVVEDGRGASTTQEFTIVVNTQPVNRPPRITSPPLSAAIAGEGYQFAPTAVDPDFDTLFWTLEEAPDGMSIDPLTGQINWEPETEDIGVHQVIVQVMDTRAAYSQLVYNLRVRAVNTPPIILSNPPTSGAVGSTYLYQVGAEDVDQDALTFSLVSGPIGMTIDAQSGRVQWTPDTGQDGNHEVTLKVTDSIGAFVTQTYTIVVADGQPNRLPVITSTPGFFVSMGEAYTYQVEATDPDGDVLAYTLLNSPNGMVIDSESGLIQWTPTAADLGTTIVEVVARDPQLGGSIQQFSLTVLAANNAPVITSTPQTTLASGSVFRYDVLATDADGEFLTYELTEGPEGMLIDGLGRMFWVPTAAQIGANSVTVKVTDPRGAFAVQTFDLTVETDTTAPQVVILMSTNVFDVGSFADIRVQAIDNVSVESLVLTLDGVAVPLDSNGIARVELDTIGAINAVATATDAAGNSATDEVTIFVSDPNDVEGPVIAITTPGDGDSVTAPTDVIGTVFDDTLVSYRLLLGDFETRNFKEIGTGTANVDNDVLGQIDPTLLQNGSYILRLEAFDAGGNGNVIEQAVEIVGELKLGNFRTRFTDLQIPVSGIDIAVDRTYDSLTSQESGDFGFGWRLNFRDTNLKVGVVEASDFDKEYGFYTPYSIGTKVYITLPGGERQGFTFLPTPGGLPGLTIYKPRFIADPGISSKLTVQSANLSFDGVAFSGFGSGQPYNPAAIDFGGWFTLTTADGTAYRINADSGNIDSITDRNGNRVVLSDAGIISENGKEIRFERDSQGRIVNISDELDNKIHYSYDSNGDLVEVIDREGNVTTYEYLSDPMHYLDKVVDPLGRTGLRVEYDANGRISQIVDINGNPTIFSFDPDERSQIVTDELGNQSLLLFDQQGNLTSRTNPLGDTWTTEYDLNGNPVKETDPLGGTTTRTFDPIGQKLSETNSFGDTTYFTYGIYGVLSSFSDALGNSTVFAVDSVGNVTSSSSPLGSRVDFTYDNKGQLLTEKDSLGRLVTYQYDEFGNRIAMVDAIGNESAFAFDANGLKIGEVRTRKVGDDEFDVAFSYQYDNNGNLIGRTDAEGNLVSTTFDELNRPTAVIDERGYQTEYSYSAIGEVDLVEFADGSSNNYVYDERGLAIGFTGRNNQVVTSTLDAAGNLVSITRSDETPGDDSDNPVQQFTTDALGRLTGYIDPLGNELKITTSHTESRQTTYTLADGSTIVRKFDAVGQLVEEINPAGQSTIYSYDDDGRLTETVYPNGTKVVQEYDSAGQLIALVNELGNRVEFVYDSLGRVISTSDALGNGITHSYDAIGNLTSTTNGNGDQTQYVYDNLGRLVRIELPLGQTASWKHDSSGNVTEFTDFNGQVTTLTWNSNGQLVAKNLDDGNTDSSIYADSGLPLNVLDGRGETVYEYDSQDRLVKRTEPDGYFVSYEYDSAGYTSSISTPSGTTQYERDNLYRITKVTDEQGGVTTYTRNQLGQVTEATYPNGIVETTTYDAQGLIASRVQMKDGVVEQSFAYTRDSAGRITQVIETDRTVEFTYDAASRLTSEKVSVNGVLEKEVVYQFDNDGNRIHKIDSQAGTTDYYYDANSRLVRSVENGVETIYQYDNNGSLISKQTGTLRIEYGYNSEGRLTTVRKFENDVEVLVVEYEYNSNGDLVGRVENGERTNYLIDNSGDFSRIIEEYDDNGETLTRFTFGDQRISRSNGSESAYYLHDGHSGTRGLASESGAITEEYKYDSFGNLIGATSSDTLFSFQGELVDSLTGLTFLRSRFLDNQTGRFITRDSVYTPPTDIANQNKYVYAANDPINNIDPSGESIIGFIFGITIVTGTAFTVANVLLGIYTASIGYRVYQRSETGREWNGTFGSFAVDAVAGGITISKAKVSTPFQIGTSFAGEYLVVDAGLGVGASLGYGESTLKLFTEQDSGLDFDLLTGHSARGGVGGGAGAVNVGTGLLEMGDAVGFYYSYPTFEALKEKINWAFLGLALDTGAHGYSTRSGPLEFRRDGDD